MRDLDDQSREGRTRNNRLEVRFAQDLIDWLFLRDSRWRVEFS